MLFVAAACVCFVMSACSVPPQTDVFERGPLLCCLMICGCILARQLVAVLAGRTADIRFWGQMFLMWSVFHVCASLYAMDTAMVSHFCWTLSAICWQGVRALCYE